MDSLNSHRIAAALLPALAVGALIACSPVDAPETGYDPPTLSEPYATESGFLVVDTTGGRLLRLDATETDATAALRRFDGVVVATQLVGDALFRLTANPPSVIRERNGVEDIVPLTAGYDRLDVREDGEVAVLSFRPGSSGTEDRILLTPREVTIVDFRNDEEPARALNLSGNNPLDFDFSPSFTLGDPDAPREVIVVRSAGEVSLLDLAPPTVGDVQRRIPLVDPGNAQSVTPASIVFGDEDPSDPFDLKMFVLANGSSALFAIDLLPAAPGDERLLQPAINQISAGGSPAQILQFEAGGRDKLLVPNRSSPSVYIVDVQTSAVSEVTLDRAVSGALVFDTTLDDDSRPRAVFFNGGDRTLQFADLTVFERQGRGAVRSVSLADGLGGIERVGAESDALALVTYASGRGAEVVNLDSRRLTPFPTTEELVDFVIADGRLFAVPRFANRLLVVDLESNATAEIELWREASRVAVSAESNALLVEHASPWGAYSVFGLDRLEEGAHTEVFGPFLADILEVR